jgi:hypothetical protein
MRKHAPSLKCAPDSAEVRVFRFTPFITFDGKDEWSALGLVDARCRGRSIVCGFGGANLRMLSRMSSFLRFVPQIGEVSALSKSIVNASPLLELFTSDKSLLVGSSKPIEVSAAVRWRSDVNDEDDDDGDEEIRAAGVDKVLVALATLDVWPNIGSFAVDSADKVLAILRMHSKVVYRVNGDDDDDAESAETEDGTDDGKEGAFAPND